MVPTLNSRRPKSNTTHKKCARTSNNETSFALAELSWSLANFNDKNPRGRFIILSDKNKRFRTKNFYKEFMKRFLKNKNVLV